MNGHLLRPLFVVGAAAVTALLLVGLGSIAELILGTEQSEFVRLTLLLSGLVGGGAAGAAYMRKGDGDT